MEDQAQALRDIMVSRGSQEGAGQRAEAAQPASAPAGKKTRIIAVASGKGGVGRPTSP